MHKLYVPVDEETYEVLLRVAQEEDRPPKTQAARWLRERAAQHYLAYDHDHED